jgi:glycosyltransferase involved in cell wall biosynthesis
LAADLFVFPSHYEGFALSLIEAMVHGIPIIASDASSIPELIRDGEHGLLFRVQDSCDLMACLRRALSAPERMKTMAQAAQARALLFSAESMVDRTLDVLAELIHS